MKSKEKNPALKLISNKFFILLLVFAIGIIMFSAVLNRNMSKVASETEKYVSGEIPVFTEYQPAVEVEDVAVEYPEEEIAVEKTEEIVDVEYKLPVEGKLQREFSVDDLVWDVTMEDWRTHCGIDIEAEIGAVVDTAATGRVADVKTDETYGVSVWVEHPDGVITVYKNLEKAVVEKGDNLDPGQMVGSVGNKGSFELAQKPHLHFEVVVDEKYVNPIEFIK